MSTQNIREEPVFPLEREITSRILEVLKEYNGRVSLVATLGILEVIKAGFIEGNNAK